MLAKSTRVGLVALLVGVLAASLALLALLATQQPAQGVYPAESGKIAYAIYDEYGTGVYLTEPNGKGNVKVYDGPGMERDPAISPSGRRIVFASREQTDPYDNELYIINRDGTHLRQITHNNKDEQDPYFSPGGDRIIYAGFDGQDYEIYELSLQAEHPRRVTDNATGDYNPVYSPNGARVAYSGKKEGERDYEIFTKLVAGGGRMQVTHDNKGNLYPDYSPSGRRIVYQSDGIYTVKATGGGRKFLSGGTYPAWAPAGKRIAFMEYSRQYATTLHTIRRDGTDEIITSHDRGDWLNWGPKVR